MRFIMRCVPTMQAYFLFVFYVNMVSVLMHKFIHINNIFLVDGQISSIYILPRTPWNFVQGGLIPEMSQVCDYDILIVLVELNTLI